MHGPYAIYLLSGTVSLPLFSGCGMIKLTVRPINDVWEVLHKYTLQDPLFIFSTVCDSISHIIGESQIHFGHWIMVLIFSQILGGDFQIFLKKFKLECQSSHQCQSHSLFEGLT